MTNNQLQFFKEVLAVSAYMAAWCEARFNDGWTLKQVQEVLIDIGNIAEKTHWTVDN